VLLPAERGDDVPPHSPTTEMVKGLQLPGTSVWMGIRAGDGGNHADMLGRLGDGGHEHDRVDGAESWSLRQGLCVECQGVGFEHEVQTRGFGTLGRLDVGTRRKQLLYSGVWAPPALPPNPGGRERKPDGQEGHDLTKLTIGMTMGLLKTGSGST